MNTDIRKCRVTAALIIINIIVFMITFIKGDPGDTAYMLKAGANFYPMTFNGQLWRIFTCTFLHFDISHLLTNMLSLFAIGSIIEMAFGTWHYLVIYSVSGLSASLVSALYHMMTGNPAVSAGASGAVFGLSGALICLAVFRKTARYGVDARRVPFAVLLSVVLSSASNVDNAAHIGGLITGFLLSLLLAVFTGTVSGHRSR